jgi:hypothetical protein
MGQVRRDSMRQRAPEFWTGAACLGPLYRKIVGFNVFKDCWGI